MTTVANVAQPAAFDDAGWVDVCASSAIEHDRGVAARIGTVQVAIFRLSAPEGACYAIDNRDPVSKANVLARGLVGSAGSVLYVASPMLKHRFALADGACLDDERLSVRTWRVRIRDGRVEVLAAEPGERPS